MIRYLVVLIFLTGCSSKLMMPDSFDIHVTHDTHKINGGFTGFSWDIEDDLNE